MAEGGMPTRGGGRRANDPANCGGLEITCDMNPELKKREGKNGHKSNPHLGRYAERIRGRRNVH
jgi:hypothetical protein